MQLVSFSFHEFQGLRRDNTEKFMSKRKYTVIKTHYKRISNDFVPNISTDRVWYPSIKFAIK